MAEGAGAGGRLVTYLVNGVALDNSALGWELRRGTLPLLSLSMEVTRSTAAGRDGVTVQGATQNQGTMRFIVRSPRENRGALLALFRTPSLLITRSDEAGLSASGTLIASSVEEHWDFLDEDEDGFEVEIQEGCWRGDEVTTAVTAAAPAGASLSLFSGMSAPVQDAVLRLTGPLEDPQVLDTSGAFMALDGTLPSGEFLRFDSDTGRAWVTDTDTWVGGTEVSGQIDFGGPRGVFEITPRFPTPTDPSTREGRVTLTQASYNAGAGFQVRGRPAFLL